MLRKISSGQLDSWYQYYRSHPWGPEIEAFRTGQICAATYNSSGRMKKQLSPSVFQVNFN